MFTRRATFLTLAVVLAACADGRQPVGLDPNRPARFVIVSGDGQTGDAGGDLAQPLTVRAVDANGNPVPNRQIALRVVAGGGSMYVGGGVSDVNGIVKDYWTLGTVAGDSQRVEARSVDPVSGNREVFGVFTAHAVAGAPVRVDPVNCRDFCSPTGQYLPYTGTVGRVVPAPFYVQVKDRFGNPVRRAGIAVKWTPSGDGTMFRTTTYTDSLGITGVRWYYGTVAGPQTLGVQVVGGEPSRTLFTGTANPGPAVNVDIETDSIHFTALNVNRSVSALATDQYGNVVSPVIFTSSNYSALTLSNNGYGTPTTLQSKQNGTFFIVATAGSVADTAVVVIRQVATSITFRTSFPTSMKVGQVVNMNDSPPDNYVIPRDSNNVIIQNPAFTSWSTTNPTVATISASGVLTAHAAGTVRVVPSIDGISADSPTITVSP
ncbi:MAG TPA: hypothetical protein VFQ45_16165 [Longimicrobium sp.]|nr:hypothetical protein [Longimicrobium sp.]